MLRAINGWLRLAIVLSGLWLVGISLYAGYSWVYVESVDSFLVYRTLPMGVNEVVVSRVPPEGVLYQQIPTPHFLWGWFWSVLGGVLLMIWLLSLGPAWVAGGFARRSAVKLGKSLRPQQPAA